MGEAFVRAFFHAVWGAHARYPGIETVFARGTDRQKHVLANALNALGVEEGIRPAAEFVGCMYSRVTLAGRSGGRRRYLEDPDPPTDDTNTIARRLKAALAEHCPNVRLFEREAIVHVKHLTGIRSEFSSRNMTQRENERLFARYFGYVGGESVGYEPRAIQVSVSASFGASAQVLTLYSWSALIGKLVTVDRIRDLAGRWDKVMRFVHPDLSFHWDHLLSISRDPSGVHGPPTHAVFV